MKSFFRRRDSKPGSQQAQTQTSNVASLIAQGNSLEDVGHLEEARAVYERAIQVAPDAFEGHLNLGNVMLLMGREIDAIKLYRRALEIAPDHAGARLNLGTALIAQGLIDEAAENYRAAVRLRPDWAEAWFGLGCALERSQPSQVDAVTEAYQEALRLDPSHGNAASNLAWLLRQSGKAQAARTVISQTLEHAPNNIPALLAQAAINRDTGDPEATITAYRRLLALSPNHGTASSDYLFALNFLPNADDQMIFNEHRRYGESLVGASPRCALPAPSSGDADKRLKIGYVSPDFRRHPVSCFIEPLLRNHDHRAFEIYCYYNHTDHDEITARVAKLADRWREIAGMPDSAVAQGISVDGIDILVDLAGHTANNRIALFARKPAPIQCTWLGYLCTTGLTTMNYRLCDAHTDPTPLAESWQVEKPVRLPNSQWCYQPQIAVPPTSALPRSTNGYWTFGSTNQASKLNSYTIRLWANLLAAIPHSRLRFIGITDSLLVERIYAEMTAHGVTTNRIDVSGRVPVESYFEFYRDIDIALDTFPYNGATTTCDSLLMGVPVATIAGRRAISRGGVSLLSTIGLEQWIAPSADSFIDMIRGLTDNPTKVSLLRAEIPKRMRASPLMDGAQFARHLEAIYRDMWHQLCARPA